MQLFFFFSSRRRHTRCREVSWARRCVQETDNTLSKYYDVPCTVAKHKGKIIASLISYIDDFKECPEEIAFGSPLDELFEVSHKYFVDYFNKNHIKPPIYKTLNTYVDPKYRGLNIYKYLLASRVPIAGQYNATSLVSENTNNFSLYWSDLFGFTRVAEIEYEKFKAIDKFGKSYSFKGINEYYTNMVNNSRPGKPLLTNLATKMVLVECGMEKATKRYSDFLNI
eukprot:TRINITY_DN22588_c0_g1_i1.p1 TRINITY_DN22588_c0_g1~~TRINITY_DN22588_c0_g1_i1.p1  ORF type:complete len:225 (-),score=47.07 TRINITY_DN22588_c0_g1_i1:115-789(-)